jgi:hypothetical protein
MAKYAPIYMSSYDGPEYSAFTDLLLSAATFEEASATGTAIGTLSGMKDAEDSLLSIVDNDGRFQLDGAGLEVGPEGDALAVGTYEVVIRETNPWVSGQTHDTTFEIEVTAAG